VLLGVAAAAAAGLSATLSGCQSYGAHAGGEGLARMERSPEWRDGEFRNAQPMWNDMHLALAHGLSGVPDNEPSAPVPVARTDPAVLAQAAASGLRVTWFGHSSTLLEIDGTRVLTDPIWSDRASPFVWIGPRRWYPPTIALARLPPVDAVLISRDDGMDEIGRRFGPFDLALVEAGQYDAAWPDRHLGPEQAVLAARRTRARR